ncbi:MAG: D-aminoacyl-tRNA deacylase [Bacteroidota bacterium]
MRCVIQRVRQASVIIGGRVKSSIGPGVLLFLGIEEQDTDEDIDWLSGKISRLRIFSDENGVMNRSLVETGGNAIVVSQFTLFAATKKGNRPSYIRAARPESAIPLYEKFITRFEAALGKKVGTGEFGADMQVEILNDGPVTIWMDTKDRE